MGIVTFAWEREGTGMSKLFPGHLYDTVVMLWLS